MTCKDCLKILVCKYNDGHNLYCKDEYKCPHFLDISALEKQIPKKPNVIGFEQNKLISSVHYSCSACDRLLSRYKYCPDCGQALDWSDTE
jgi:hypothetical protein